ncbi:MAG: hypothetical protein HY240_01565 [Actinobacteria bacterium]|nr:hypothetical protein [Actinomycetota bacterium]
MGTNAGNGTWTYTFDGAGRMTQATGPGSTGAQVRRDYGYDGASNRISSKETQVSNSQVLSNLTKTYDAASLPTELDPLSWTPSPNSATDPGPAGQAPERTSQRRPPRRGRRLQPSCRRPSPRGCGATPSSRRCSGRARPATDTGRSPTATSRRAR